MNYLRAIQICLHDFYIQKSSTPRNLIVVVPDHAELAQGTLRSILRQAGISFDDFVELWSKS